MNVYIYAYRYLLHQRHQLLMLCQRLQQLHDERKVVVLPPNVFNLPMNKSDHEVREDCGCVIPPDPMSLQRWQKLTLYLLSFWFSSSMRSWYFAISDWMELRKVLLWSVSIGSSWKRFGQKSVLSSVWLTAQRRRTVFLTPEPPLTCVSWVWSSAIFLS